MSFEKNVFVNCPFDDEFIGLLRPLLFTLLDLGFQPRIALESLDSGKPRIDKIVSLIRESRYAIHDLSRLQARKRGEYSRLNMPFELGIDIGCTLFKGGKFATRKCLILEEKRYRYQAALSDLSNSDIGVHGAQPVKVAEQVRNWLASEVDFKPLSASAIFGRFTDFMADNYVVLTEERQFSKEEVEALPVPELVEDMVDWIAQNPWQR